MTRVDDPPRLVGYARWRRRVERGFAFTVPLSQVVFAFLCTLLLGYTWLSP